jgi:hypothetical protein
MYFLACEHGTRRIVLFRPVDVVPVKRDIEVGEDVGLHGDDGGPTYRVLKWIPEGFNNFLGGLRLLSNVGDDGALEEMLDLFVEECGNAGRESVALHIE